MSLLLYNLEPFALWCLDEIALSQHLLCETRYFSDPAADNTLTYTLLPLILLARVSGDSHLACHVPYIPLSRASHM